ncbi:MAG: sulfatase-like hydrolase/transferase [Polyangiaceae bacterium]|nr:sulfatase-like hydrolase/transferase [Polyangiaceae bacterium]
MSEKEPHRASAAPDGDLRPNPNTAKQSLRAHALREVAEWRRRLVWVLLLAPAWLSVALDVWRRAPRLWAMNGLLRLAYAGALLESLLVWALLLHAASRRRGVGRHVAAVLFVFFATLVHAGQSYFFEQNNVYLNSDVSRFATDFAGSVLNQFLADLPNYLKVMLPAGFVAGFWVWLARRWVRPRQRQGRATAILAPLVLVATFFIPTHHRQAQASTPDVLYLNAMGDLLEHELGLTADATAFRPRARASLHVPRLSPRVQAPRNLVLFILESVRADSTCSEYSSTCKKTPFSNRLLPNRVPLHQLRALDSTTAISLAVLWTGVTPNESREVLHTWPVIFDYARAAGFQTAFWTSQNMLFGNARLWVEKLAADKFASATDLDPTADLDTGAPEELLADRALSEMAQLKEPFLAVIQLSNTHYPYRVEDSVAQPFQPATTSKGPAQNAAFKNYYQNSIYQQDRHIARMIEGIRSSNIGARTVLLYTSDHGEAFREHNQMGHTFSIFDEEIKVPGWVDAPPGTLSLSESQYLAGKSNEFTFHVDIVPTMLDLMGVLDAPEITQFRTRMPGTSWLRSQATEQPLPMTNCAGVWGCAFENWGVMQGPLKVAARAWDSEYHCYDVLADPLEQTSLNNAPCDALKLVARQRFPRLPGRSEKSGK